MSPKTRSLSVPEAMQPRHNEITALTDALCQEKLNEEYAQLCREMTAALASCRFVAVPSIASSPNVICWNISLAQAVQPGQVHGGRARRRNQ